MRRVDADFARRSSLRWPWLIIVGVSLTVAAWQSLEAWMLWKSSLAVEDDIAMIRTQLDTARAAAHAASVKAGSASQADGSPSRTTRFDWNGVFASIHAARVPGVRLAVIDVSAKDGTVRLEVEAPRTDDILLYLSTINEGEPDPRWQLVRMQKAVGASSATGTIEAPGGSFGR